VSLLVSVSTSETDTWRPSSIRRAAYSKSRSFVMLCLSKTERVLRR
jgi:hypothetical protein